jgi:hypothetical protein
VAVGDGLRRLGARRVDDADDAEEAQPGEVVEVERAVAARRTRARRRGEHAQALAPSRHRGGSSRRPESSAGYDFERPT